MTFPLLRNNVFEIFFLVVHFFFFTDQLKANTRQVEKKLTCRVKKVGEKNKLST